VGSYKNAGIRKEFEFILTPIIDIIIDEFN